MINEIILVRHKIAYRLSLVCYLASNPNIPSGLWAVNDKFMFICVDSQVANHSVPIEHNIKTFHMDNVKGQNSN